MSWYRSMFLLLVFGLSLVACGSGGGSGGVADTPHGEEVGPDTVAPPPDIAGEVAKGPCGMDCPPVIQGATVSDDWVWIPFFGDLWAATWAVDDRLFLSFGDGTGLPLCVPTYDDVSPGAWMDWISAVEVAAGCFDVSAQCPQVDCVLREVFCGTFDCSVGCFPLCPWTDAGLIALEGPLTDLAECPGPDGCVVTRHLPFPGVPPVSPAGEHVKDDKPSSLLYLDGRLILAGHTPSGAPEVGYLASSEDDGKTWTQVEGTPWVGGSVFKDLMFIQMGKAYELNTDGYVYALGVEEELALEIQPVCLARVPRAQILDYTAYEYFAGLDGQGEPDWSDQQEAAAPLPGLGSFVQGAAIYHPGIERYLFLSGVVSFEDKTGALFEAPTPWGPWTVAVPIPGAAISSLLPKGAEDERVYFTRAGGTASYNLQIGHIDFVVAGD